VPTTAPAPPTAKRPGDTTSSRPSKAAKPNKASVIPDEYLPPNNILFIRDVPDDYSNEMLEALFARYPGFREVRTIPVPAYKGCAFVEYEANEGAIQAREALNGRVLGDGEKGLRVTYQKSS
jgi:RNA recognition motif-containing protein